MRLPALVSAILARGQPRPRRIQRRMTPFGRVLLTLALALALSALAWERPLPLYLGLALLAAQLVARLLVARPLASIEGRWLLPDPIVAGEDVTVGGALRARHATPPVSLHARQPGGARSIPIADLAGLGPTASRVSWVARFPRRGLVDLPPLVIECRQPFGLVAATRMVGKPCQALVLPAVGILHQRLEYQIRAWLESEHPGDAPGDEEFDHLKPFRPGENWRWIHWRASARARRLLTIRRQNMAGRRLALLLDATDIPGQRRRLERLISVAATLVDHFLGQGWSMSLHGPFAPADGFSGDRRHLLEVLALIEGRAPAPLFPFLPPHTPCLALTLRADPGLPDDPAIFHLPLAKAEAMVRLPRGGGA